MVKLAIHGGKPYRQGKLPPWPIHDKWERAALLNVLKSGDWGGVPFQNTVTREVGLQFAAAQDANFAIPLANGTVTLELALRAFGIGPNDEVLVPAVTFVSTASSVLFVGAVPVIVDVAPDGYTMDIEKAREAITPRTRAIIPVHFGNQVADIDGVLALAKEFGLRVIEDSAHAHGARWRHKGTGSWGDFGSFSFQTNKLITSGEGGMLITNDEKLAERVETLSNCGQLMPAHRHGFRSVGTNARMTEFQAAILFCQFQRFEEQVARRERSAALLTDLLAGTPGLILPRRDARVTRQSHYRFLMSFNEAAFDGVTRDQFAYAVEAEGVFVRDIYTPVHRSSQFHLQAEIFPQVASRLDQYRDLYCANAERMLRNMLAIPHPFLLGSDRDIRAIAGAFRKVLDNIDELREVTAPAPESWAMARRAAK